jgi:hypothetical protein
MDIANYRSYYIRFIVTTLAPSVKRAVNNDPEVANNPVFVADLENWKNGLCILALVAFIEANFLSSIQIKLLRKFQAPLPQLPQAVNLTHLSCFIYMRDCFAHDPNGLLFPGQQNTNNFLAAISGGKFAWAAQSSQKISVVPNGIHELHLIILRLFGEQI